MATATFLIVATVAGIPIAHAIDRRARTTELVGLGFLYGAGTISMVLLTLSLMGVRWSSLSMVAPLAVIATAAAIFAARSKDENVMRPAAAHEAWAWSIDAITVYLMIGYALYSTIASPWQYDFTADWGLKGRVFFEAGTIDWRFLGSPSNDYSHPDYPLLLPLDFSAVALFGGQWNDRWLGAITVAFAAALLLILRNFAARETKALAASAITLAASMFVMTGHIAMAEGPLIAYGTAALLYIRRAVTDDDRASFLHGALLLGLAANCKNEGMALFAAIAVALLAISARAALRLWPALLLIAPWTIARSLHRLPTDLWRGSFAARFAERLDLAGDIGGALLQYLADRWILLLLAGGIIVAWREIVPRERLVLIATVLQLAFFIAVYFGTPLDPLFHVRTSWPRLTRQVATPLLFIVLSALARVWFIRRSPDEAREANS